MIKFHAHLQAVPGRRRTRGKVLALAAALFMLAAVAIVPQCADETEATTPNNFQCKLDTALNGGPVTMWFHTLSVSEDESTLTVQVGYGGTYAKAVGGEAISYYPAIPADSAGALGIPASFTYHDSDHNKDYACEVVAIGFEAFGADPYISAPAGVGIPSEPLSCTKLKSVVIPDSVTSIGYAAFAYCTGLEKIVFGTGLSDVRGNSFAGLHFFDTDGNTPLAVTVQNLAGATFSGTATQLVKQVSGGAASGGARVYDITALADSGARLTPQTAWTVTAGGTCQFSIALQPGYALSSIRTDNASVYSDGASYYVTGATGPVTLTVSTADTGAGAGSGSGADGSGDGNGDIDAIIAAAAIALLVCAVIGMAFYRRL